MVALVFLTGLGEASQMPVDDAVAVEALRKYFEYCRGQSPFDVEKFREQAFREARKRKYPARVDQTCASALEQAHWDIIGKALNVPAVIASLIPCIRWR